MSFPIMVDENSIIIILSKLPSLQTMSSAYLKPRKHKYLFPLILDECSLGQKYGPRIFHLLFKHRITFFKEIEGHLGDVEASDTLRWFFAHRQFGNFVCQNSTPNPAGYILILFLKYTFVVFTCSIIDRLLYCPVHK